MGSEKTQGQLWGAEPEGWASHESNHAPLFQAMMAASAIGAGTRVLDIGCGAGHSTALIHATGAHVIGVDAAQGMVDHASATFDGLDFRVGGIEELDFVDDAFDVVFAANSVQYAADLGTALHELARVCRPGGLIVAGLFGPPETVAYKPVLESLGQFMPKPPPGAKPGGPFRLSGPGVLEAGFAAAGIQVEGTGEANCPFEYRSWDAFWRGTKAAGPTQMAISRAGLDTVEQATRTVVEPFTAADGSIAFDPNTFIFVVARASPIFDPGCRFGNTSRGRRARPRACTRRRSFSESVIGRRYARGTAPLSSVVPRAAPVAGGRERVESGSPGSRPLGF